MSQCVKCGSRKPMVFVHGHYQCANCKCITDGDCCQGVVLNHTENDRQVVAEKSLKIRSQ